jgi:hypothetical protein
VLAETPGQSVERSASAASVADLDGDGDLDLLIGNIEGALFWNRNDGSRSQHRFGRRVALQAGGKPLQAAGGDGHAVATDWDGDGVLDLLVAGGEGRVVFHAGTRRSAQGLPAFQPGQPLQAGGKPIRYPQRVKLALADWNGDGKLDLLCGTKVPQSGQDDHGNIWVLLRQPDAAR